MVAEHGGPSSRLIGRSALTLCAAGPLILLATLLHPSRETPATIMEAESRLVASHALYTVAYLLAMFGLAALSATATIRGGRLAQTGLVASFMGTGLLAVSGNFGFLAPVLATESPEAITAIEDYPPVVLFNAAAALGFAGGWVILGIAILSGGGGFARVSGASMALGAPMHLVGFGLAQFVSASLWFLAVLGSLLLGSALVWCGYRAWLGSRVRRT